MNCCKSESYSLKRLGGSLIREHLKVPNNLMQGIGVYLLGQRIAEALFSRLDVVNDNQQRYTLLL